MTVYEGETFKAPQKLQNGSAGLPEVYAWANSVLGTNSGSALGTNYYPLETIHADIFQNGGDDLFVAEPAWRPVHLRARTDTVWLGDFCL